MNTLFGGHRYQVFLSSTFKDLIEERQQVIQTLQRIACFPVAMEHFPASYEEQWTYIKPLIEKSDYFVCIIAGKYGHCGEDGKSFTQREFEYALSCKVPILVFYHADIKQLAAHRVEEGEEMRQRLNNFLQFAKRDRLCEGWHTKEQLPALVMQSVLEMATTCPRPGWRHRADKSKEYLELELQNAQLRQQLDEMKTKARNAPIACFSHYDDAVSSVSMSFAEIANACERSGEIMKIRILGVCLHKSLPTLIHFLGTSTRNIRIEVRLAILSQESEVYRNLDPRWKPLYDIFLQDLKELLSRLRSGAGARNISIKLAQYCHMPNWHGILINYESLFMGHCLWHEDGRFTAGQNPYDQYRAGESTFHDRKIKQYVHWFDLCRRADTRSKSDQLLLDTSLSSSTEGDGRGPSQTVT